ncbi:sigma-E factor negative regulatory protein [Aquisalimonas sp. 2447]|uniref:sigma-E factor negative regulatory protein n=1 Tax=Aquisalimonas sp. 2447 TaxID=2740807 RepID=UPI001432608E|nr:sigma-E factor negative regulatory protein [Aquisalimonas sp. 2447]QIT55463.1 sigma-E factor negative regulatory protein [Aquisalimonas sp. 2447]
MTKPYAEQLSALTDEELPPSEMALLVRQAQRSPEVAAQLGRYAVIREALHRNLPDSVNTGLAERVSAALEEEPAHAGPVPSRQRRWLRPVAGVAVAASVALVAIGLWPEQQTSAPGQSPMETVSVSGAGSQAGQPVRTENIQWDRLDPDIQARLQEYAVTRGEPSEAQLDFLSRPVGVSDRRSDR